MYILICNSDQCCEHICRKTRIWGPQLPISLISPGGHFDIAWQKLWHRNGVFNKKQGTLNEVFSWHCSTDIIANIFVQRTSAVLDIYFPEFNSQWIYLSSFCSDHSQVFKYLYLSYVIQISISPPPPTNGEESIAKGKTNKKSVILVSNPFVLSSLLIFSKEELVFDEGKVGDNEKTKKGA